MRPALTLRLKRRDALIELLQLLARSLVAFPLLLNEVALGLRKLVLILPPEHAKEPYEHGEVHGTTAHAASAASGAAGSTWTNPTSDPYAQGGEPKDGGWQQPTSYQDTAQDSAQDGGWQQADGGWSDAGSDEEV